jgi:hypothetical protein
MKLILNFLWCSLVAQSVAAQVERPIADTCLPHYRLSRAEVANCQITKNEQSPFLIEMTMLGKSLADGFRFNWNPNQMNGHFSTVLFANNGTTIPLAGVFQPCPGNWLYFKGRGFRKSVQNANTVDQYQDISFRVRYWGDIRKPDSLKLEYKSATITGAYVTTRRDSVCNKCLATDKMPPQITGCPNGIVELPMPADPTKVNGNDVMKQIGIKATDNCGVYNATNYPYWTSVTNGQVIDYKTVAYDASGNRSVCQFKVKWGTRIPPLADTCFAYFNMESSTSACDGASLLSPSNSSKTIRLLGKRIADGIEIHSSTRNPIGSAGSSTVLLGKNGSTTPPTGSSYSTCSGNWTYFIASGLSSSFSIHTRTKTELTNVHIRVKHFGNESNPDSLRIEYSGGGFFNTSTKSTYCNKCQATDNIAPVIKSCPTQIVPYPVTSGSIIDGNSVANAAFTVTDNCQLEDVSTYPYEVRGVKNGQIIDFHTVAYDKAGNKSVCQFKAQVIVPVPAPAKLVENQSIAFEIQGISPNPTDGALTVTLESYLAKEVTFEFYNSLGEKAHSVTTQVQKGENSLFFDVTKLANGIYFIQTSEQGEKIPLTKFVKH